VFRALIIIIFSFLLFNCSNKTTYSGKILNQEDLNNINFKNKEILTAKLGVPSFVDPIENKYFYHSEKNQKKSIFGKKTSYNFIFVFEFNEYDKIVNSSVYDLTKSKNNIDFIKDETKSEVVRRGLIEKVFGGVGAQQELPTTP